MPSNAGRRRVAAKKEEIFNPDVLNEEEEDSEKSSPDFRDRKKIRLVRKSEKSGVGIGSLDSVRDMVAEKIKNLTEVCEETNAIVLKG